MTMCSNDRLGGVATSLSHFKYRSLTRSTARCNGGRSPFAGSGGDIDRHLILKRRKPSPARRIALLLPALRHLSPDGAYLPNVGNWGAFTAAPSFFELRKHSDRQVSDCSPSHVPIPFMNSRLDGPNHSRTRVENVQFPVGEIRNV